MEPTPKDLNPADHPVADGVGEAVIGLYINLIRATRIVNHCHGLRDNPKTLPLGDEILRAGIVTFHAAFEAFVRRMLRCLIPKRLPMLPAGQRDRSYSDRAGKVIKPQVLEEWLAFHSISRVETLESDLRTLNVDPARYDQYFERFAWTMDRRHKIVHEADLVTIRPPRLRSVAEADIPYLTRMSQNLKDFAAQLVQEISPGMRISDWNYIKGLAEVLDKEQEHPAWSDDPQS